MVGVQDEDVGTVSRIRASILARMTHDKVRAECR